MQNSDKCKYKADHQQGRSIINETHFQGKWSDVFIHSRKLHRENLGVMQNRRWKIGAGGDVLQRKWWSPKGPVTYAGGYVSANIGEYLYSSRSSPHVCSSAGRINIDHPMRQTSEYISLFYFMNLWSSLSFDSIRISHRFENMPGLTECPRYSDNMGWLLAVIGCICLS